MNIYRALIFSVVLLLMSSSQSARADTSSGDGGAWLLLFGGAVITGVNLVNGTLGDGSEGFGIAGMVLGTTLITYSYVKDIEDAGFFAAGGAVTAAVGAANFFITREHKSAAQVSGMHVAPCIVPGSEHAAGIELSYRW